jgi:iron complex transport system substrate-binding protein
MSAAIVAGRRAGRAVRAGPFEARLCEAPPCGRRATLGLVRVVSLACSNTEIVCALGCADLLVGIDDHSDYPVDVVARLPRVGPDLTPDIDRVAALEPDLVLATLTVPGHERVIERLEAAGLPYIAPEPMALADVYRDVEDIGARLGAADRAREVADAMRRELEGTPATDDGGDRPTILIEWWPKPVIAPGRLSWTSDLIARAGGANPLGAENVKSRPLTDEDVRELDPDAIVLSWCGVPFEKYRTDVVYDNATWRSVSAITGRQVHCVPEAFLGRPSPRLIDGFRALRVVVEAARAARGARVLR